MEILEKAGYQWSSGAKPTTRKNWYNGKESCIDITTKDISYASRDFYKRNDKKVISFKKFLKIQDLI